MDRRIIEDRLKDNKFFGQLVGVWPDQDKPKKYFIRFITIFIVMLSNAAQVARIVVFFSAEVLTDQLPFLMLGCGIIVKQVNYILNEDKVRDLLHDIVHDWEAERPKEEFEILELHSKRAVTLSFVYKVSILFSLVAFLLVPAVPHVLDIIIPLNESRNRLFVYPSYYFVDEQRYYYAIQGHLVVCALILASVFIACDLNLVHVVQHACALLIISGHRFQHAMDGLDSIDEKQSDVLTENNYVKVTECIIDNKRANEYAKKIDACHVHYFAVAIGLITMIFAVSLVKLTSLEMGSLYITFCAFIVAQLVHVFFLTVMGQFIADSNEDTFRRICSANWYNGSIKSQALYLFVMRKYLNPPKLTGGKIIDLNLASFVQIVKASFSYYTVFKDS